jgi:hypothetical protein
MKLWIGVGPNVPKPFNTLAEGIAHLREIKAFPLTSMGSSRLTAVGFEGLNAIWAYWGGDKDLDMDHCLSPCDRAVIKLKLGLAHV